MVRGKNGICMTVSLYLRIYFFVTGLLMIAAQKIAEGYSSQVFPNFYSISGWGFLIFAVVLSFISVVRKALVVVEIKRQVQIKHLFLASTLSVLSTVPFLIYYITGGTAQWLFYMSLVVLLLSLDPLFYGIRNATQETYGEALDRLRAEIQTKEESA